MAQTDKVNAEQESLEMKEAFAEDAVIPVDKTAEKKKSTFWEKLKKKRKDKKELNLVSFRQLVNIISTN